MAETSRIDDRGYVVGEYADDSRLSVRSAFWSTCPKPQPVDVALERILDLGPIAVLEVGCGQGAFAAELLGLGFEVSAIDQSEKMVALTASRGVPAQRADVQHLPFDAGTFDLVVASYMLYHVPDIPRALDEIARVLRPGGALIAVTNSERKLHEMWDLVGRKRDRETSETFSRENGEDQLTPHFATVERIDVDQQFTVTEEAIRAYVQATRFAELVGNIPDLPDGLTVTAAGSVFIATT